jgi:hypothetical protein
VFANLGNDKVTSTDFTNRWIAKGLTVCFPQLGREP